MSLSSKTYPCARSLPRNLLGYASAILVLLAASAPAQVREGDDLYLESFHLIQQGDGFLKAGNKAAALSKYRQAESGLVDFRRLYPDVAPKMVAFRMNYVAEKVTECSEKPAAEKPEEGQTAASPSSARASGGIKLLAAGAEPKKVLRLHPKAGDKQALGMSIKIAMEMGMGGMQAQNIKLPVIKMPLDVTVKSVSADGDISYESVVGEPSMEADAAASPQLAEVMKTSLGSLKGLSGAGTISSRGLVKKVEMQLPAGADPQARQALNQVKDSVAQMAIPLPEEPVGPGAKWEFSRPIVSQGMTMDQTATYELVSVEGETIKAKTTVVQSAKNQKIESPAMPGLKVDVVKMNGRGGGDLTFDLAQPFPLAANADLHSEITMGMNAGGQKQTIDMKLDFGLQFQTR